MDTSDHEGPKRESKKYIAVRELSVFGVTRSLILLKVAECRANKD